MNQLISGILASLALLVAETGSSGCIFLWVDEPECPKQLIKM